MKTLYKYIFLLFFCAACNSQQHIADSTVHTTFGISFPPITNKEQRNFSTPILQELNVKRIRFGENWKYREPEKGKFNWNPLDDRIDWALENNQKVLITIQSNAADWACSDIKSKKSCVFKDNSDFKNYIELLLKRYPNKITKIQFGNEWQTLFWYAGTAQQYVQANNIVYEAVQKHSPKTKVVLGGFTSGSQRFMTACNGLIDDFFDDDGNTYNQDFFDKTCNSTDAQELFNRIEYVLTNALYDEVDIHLYDDVEKWDEYYNFMQTKTQKPIIVTEFGGPNVNIEPTDETYQASQLKKYINKLDSLQVSEAYYFKLVEGTQTVAHVKSGLIDGKTLQKKESYFVFKDYINK